MRTILAFVLLASPAFGETVYGDAAGCQRHAGQPVNTDMVFILHTDKIERHESICPISGITPLQGGGMKLHVTCSGEGESWTDSYILDDWDDVATLNVRPAQDATISFNLSKCAG